MHTFHCLALVLTASLAPACATEDTDPLTDDTMEQEFRCPTCADGRDGSGYNTEGQLGTKIGAFLPHGPELHGVLHTRTTLGRDGIGEVEVFDITAENGILHGYDQNGNAYSGVDFEGSVWTFELGMEVFEQPPSQDPNETIEWVMVAQTFISDGDRSRYVFTNGLTEDLAESFKCDMDPETGEYSAIIYSDLDVDDSGNHVVLPNALYFGCISGAIGKAGMWGYAQHAVGLTMHQTATRMIRADYCGTGQSYTVTGTRLQMQDDLGIRSFVDTFETTEAMWTSEGAVCLLQPRRPEHTFESVKCPNKVLPFCENDTDLNDWGAQLWTKTMPQISP